MKYKKAKINKYIKKNVKDDNMPRAKTFHYRLHIFNCSILQMCNIKVLVDNSTFECTK